VCKFAATRPQPLFLEGSLNVAAAGLIYSLCPLRLCGELLVKLFWFEERKEDDFSDGYIVCQNHNKSIDTYTKPTGRRHTVF